jgi:uncharacterized membrane protein
MRNPADALTQALIPLITTVAAIVVLTVVIYLIRSWWRENDGPAASDHELLGEYRELNRRGDLSDEEFRIIKGRMASRIRGEPDSPRKPDQQHDQKEKE